MSFKDKWNQWSEEGIRLPFAFDPVDRIPSPTLLFFYITFVLAFTVAAISSGAMIVKGDYLTATMAPIGMTLMGFVFYRLRKLDRVKFDLNDQEIELSSDEDEKEVVSDEK